MASKEPFIGRPPTYKTVAEMQEKIDQYFKDCDGTPITDKDGNAVYDKYGNPAMRSTPYTITGLSLALGFTSRHALLGYEAKDAFAHTIARAKSRVEAYAEGKLFESGIANGAKFALGNNFYSWADKQEVKQDIDATVKVELSDELKDYSK